MFIKRTAAAMIAVLTLTQAAACSVDLSSSADESRTVVTVNEWEVPFEMYRYAVLMNLRDQAEIAAAQNDAESKSSGTDSKSVENADESPSDALDKLISSLTEEERAQIAVKVRENAMETITNIYSLFTAANEAGIEPFGDMINMLTETEMEEIRKSYGGDRKYLNEIKRFFMNDSVYSILTRYEILFDRLYTEYIRTGVIDDSDEAIIAHMNGSDAVRVKQILISFERHSEAEALKIAENVREELLESVSEEGIADEEIFDSLTDKYGEDLFMYRNRDGYYIPRGYTDEKFEEAAFALKEGHLSDIVRTSAGYSILLRLPRDPGFISENTASLKDTCLAGIYRSMLDKYKDSAQITETDGFFDIDIYGIK